MTEVRRQRSDDRGQMTEVRRQRSEDRRLKLEVGNHWLILNERFQGSAKKDRRQITDNT